MKKYKKVYIIFTILITFFSISIVNKTIQNDTFSAIKIGDYILKHGLDFIEHFNMQTNLSYHNARYLFNIIIAIVYNHFGFFGIYLFACLITAIIGNMVFNILLKLKNNMVVSFLTTMIMLFCSKVFFTSRAQIMSYLFLTIQLYSIEKLIKTNNYRYIFYIILCSILTANIHTTIWLMTLLLFMPYFMEYILSKTKYIKRSKRLYYDYINIKILLVTFLLVLFSGLCTPLKDLPYTYMFKTLSGASTLYITELQKVNIFSNYSLLIYTIIYILLFVYFKIKIKISDLFLVIGLYIMSILASRNIAFLTILTVIVIARLITSLLESKSKKLDDEMNKVMNCNLVLIPISIFILIVSFYNFYDNYLSTKYINNEEYPVKASKFINSNIDKSKMRLFNDFNNGAYLEFNNIKVFLDSRSEVYCKEFNDTSILTDYYAAYYGFENYKTIFNKYNFTHILVKKEKKKNIIYSYIEDDSDYKLIYEDKYYLIYEKIK